MRRRYSSILRLGAALLTVLIAGAAPGAEAKPVPGAGDGGGAKSRPDKPSLPTPEYIQQTFDEGAYEQTIEAVGRVLRLTGKAAKEYDRPALLQLKAESLLRIKAAEPAARAFGEAADATADPDERDRLRATQLLLKRSPGLTYTPKQRRGSGDASAAPGIDVVDPERRKAALAAQWADELARLEPVVKGAVLERELPPIAEAVKDVTAARPLESAATDGEGERTGEMLDGLNKRGLRLIAKRLDRTADRVASIADSADQTFHVGYRYGSGRRASKPFGPQVRRSRVGGAPREIRQRKGLTPAQKTELQELLGTCRAVAEAAREFAELSGKVSADAKTIINKAGTTAQEVRRVAKAG